MTFQIDSKAYNSNTYVEVCGGSIFLFDTSKSTISYIYSLGHHQKYKKVFTLEGFYITIACLDGRLIAVEKLPKENT